jgi:hypothetical protein
VEFTGGTILPLEEEWDMVDGVDVVDMVDIAFGSFFGR